MLKLQSIMAREEGKHDNKTTTTTTAEQGNSPIHGDILDKIMSHMPLIHLVSPSQVSKSWKRAVSSSLLHTNKPKPWLIIHTQSTIPPFSTSSSCLAYDPRTNHWINISKPSSYSSSTVRSSHSSLLYTLSPTTLSISMDSLHLNWNHLPPPSTWRTDPIVVSVGRRIIVAGGACDFDDNPTPMEIFNPETEIWEPCNSMPEQLRDIACSQWVSVSVEKDSLYVTEKLSGTTFSFRLESRTWMGPVMIRPDTEVYFCSTGFCKDRFLLVGLVGEAEDVKAVRVYQVSFDLEDAVLLSEMSEECVGMLKGEECVWSVDVCFVGSFVYVCNAGVVVVGEWGECGVWKWWWVKNASFGERSLVERMVFSAGDVGIEDVWRARSFVTMNLMN